jgi:hypothetical protein
MLRGLEGEAMRWDRVVWEEGLGLRFDKRGYGVVGVSRFVSPLWAGCEGGLGTQGGARGSLALGWLVGGLWPGGRLKAGLQNGGAFVGRALHAGGALAHDGGFGGGEGEVDG